MHNIYDILPLNKFEPTQQNTTYLARLLPIRFSSVFILRHMIKALVNKTQRVIAQDYSAVLC